MYDGERYSVRDNGAVLRHPRAGRPPRPSDCHWTFGKPNDKTGYVEIASVRVHRIVATAFHGDPPTREHVVDHIDTNRRNNRPENLRWLTRLENALFNPITLRRIELVCGSVEAFLANPSLLGSSNVDPNFTWMRAVTTDEAKASLERLRAWAASDKPSSGAGALGEWLYRPTESQALPQEPPPSPNALTPSKTSGAVQRHWRTPSEFPLCPLEGGDRTVPAYAERLRAGEMFALSSFGSSKIIEWALTDDDKTLLVLCDLGEGIKQWGLVAVTMENDLFVHDSRGTFFERAGAEKQYTEAQGLEWTGEDSIDNYM